jgi:hypothetical protein
MYRPFRRTAISGHTRLISGHKAEIYHAITYAHLIQSRKELLRYRGENCAHRLYYREKRGEIFHIYTENL